MKRHPVIAGLMFFTLNLTAAYISLIIQSMQGAKDLDRLRNDAFRLADWHNKRANYIDEILISNQK